MSSRRSLVSPGCLMPLPSVGDLPVADGICLFSAALARVLLYVFSVGLLVLEHFDHALLASDSLRYI